MKTAAWIALYFLMWMVTWPALLADVQYGDVYSKYSPDSMYVDDLAESILIGLLPPMWIATPFITGFYEHGFQIGRRRE